MAVMSSWEENESDGGVAVQEGRPKLKEPPKYAVVLHNDDYTTMEFVVEVLKRFFRKQEEEAVRLTVLIHTQGRAVGGVFSHEIAEAKVFQVSEAARSSGFPLKCTSEPA